LYLGDPHLPAKSNTPYFHAQPDGFQIQYTKGQYTMVIQRKVKTIAGKRRPRSTTAPIQIPTVTQAISTWKKLSNKSGRRGVVADGDPKTFFSPICARLPMYPLLEVEEKASE
jgi:hypothetical protein